MLYLRKEAIRNLQKSFLLVRMVEGGREAGLYHIIVSLLVGCFGFNALRGSISVQIESSSRERKRKEKK